MRGLILGSLVACAVLAMASAMSPPVIGLPNPCAPPMPCMRRAGCVVKVKGCSVCKKECIVGLRPPVLPCAPLLPCMRRGGCVEKVNGCPMCKKECIVGLRRPKRGVPVKPAVKPAILPVKPAVKPAILPAVKPAILPVKPAVKPAILPIKPAVKPAILPIKPVVKPAILPPMIGLPNPCAPPQPCMRKAGCMMKVKGCSVCKKECIVMPKPAVLPAVLPGKLPCAPLLPCMRKGGCVKKVNGCPMCKKSCIVMPKPAIQPPRLPKCPKGKPCPGVCAVGLDKNGCQTCSCPKKPKCPKGKPCPGHCSIGRDQNGCQLCNCPKIPVNPVKPAILPVKPIMPVAPVNIKCKPIGPCSKRAGCIITDKKTGCKSCNAAKFNCRPQILPVRPKPPMLIKPAVKPVQFKDCKKTEHGAEYRGRINRTASGKTCQAWNSQKPHEHDRFDMLAKDDKPGNFCRNPDGELAPWCYTTDPATRWEYCDVPLC